MTEDNVYVCSLCYPHAVEITEFGEEAGAGLCLFENEGRFGLMSQPGHGDRCVVLWFPKKPISDPDKEGRDDLPPEVEAAATAWVDQLDELDEMLKMDPITGHFFIECCRAIGWDSEHQVPRTCRFSVWLINTMGEVIQKCEQTLANGEAWKLIRMECLT